MLSSPGAPARRRQWGAETRTRPLSTVHPTPSTLKVTLGGVAIAFTVVAWIAYVLTTVVRQFFDDGPVSFQFTMETISYLVVVSFLTFSALMYLIARQGALLRFGTHSRAPRAQLDRHFTHNQRPMTVLVPSYAEEPDVVSKTLWSAALQEYPALRVVLLVDDPTYPTDPAIAARLEQTRGLAAGIQAELAVPAARFNEALIDAEIESHRDELSPRAVQELVEHYSWAAQWLRAKAASHEGNDHVDEFFTAQVLGALAEELELTASALDAADRSGERLPDVRLLELYRRLAWTFSAELDTFERKRYASLSHEANKAMNLNSYIGLMGADYRVEETPLGSILVPDETGDVHIPDADYLLTLDADSLLLRDYCLRLVYLLEQPENARVAVTQTPYSAFRGAPTRIERLAGATTDLQHILHQGFTYFGATFWVGANAVIRKRALADIVEVEYHNGFPVSRFVQDRTVIEDTESSVDLAAHGWTLVNYPERLSYSATPPDFGSLIVQRRRWANGGLLILPKLWSYVRAQRARGERVRVTELALRTNYMASIAWASFGLLFLLAYPYDSRLLSPIILLAALPYFLAMASDLRYTGYRARDIFWIYGFNLILLPVNLAGVLKSIQQAITNQKIPFARTPKVKNRTAAPFLYVIVPLLIVAFSVLTFVRDYAVGNWGNAAFAGINAVLALAAIVSYIGIGHSIVDLWFGAIRMLYVPDRRAGAVSTGDLDWRAVLHYGADGATSSPIVPVDIAPTREPLGVSR
ncbi:cellulose synthase (UDP-forming) [Microbacteriaceae bacterium SG_E_30_P1]|uniref:Cellulose synthase (UDP-forming) n=1 Tax=Antiquaquibacter oligotrophicus TaxID=2880260 RepID=A0ABT6KJR6_9MICO|nr:glycosyltransferase family 2 protein [Antiquaquibacter oligotrophicus]MDH6180247.1 cellulose synthase (UDP-forming) [Antiquaquibacter oligotrophicus]UDF14006.1 glycosyltransferase family 2 protein [Antiquaquibacter oligotrophicus]